MAASGMPWEEDGLRETVLAALSLVSLATIHRRYVHCVWIIDAYALWFDKLVGNVSIFVS